MKLTITAAILSVQFGLNQAGSRNLEKTRLAGYEPVTDVSDVVRQSENVVTRIFN
jgi:hypothetical protein